MKKIFLNFIVLSLALILTACSSSPPDESAAQVPDNTREFVIAPEVALIIGTVRLDETNYAIDAAQAKELLPLWKALRSLSKSETTATAEVEAIVKQIQSTMTANQMDAIKSMGLSIQDLNVVSEILGLENTGFGSDDMDPELLATLQAARESGEARPEGGFGGQGLGGGQGPGRAEGLDPAARETAIAARGGTRGANLTINENLLNAIIEFLDGKNN